MGGNLFKLGRISKAEYLKIETEIRKYLDKKLNHGYKIPRFYSNKPDFGDLDIIINGKELGGFILGFKNQFEDFSQFILDNSQKEIEYQIIKYYQTFTVSFYLSQE